MGDIILKGMLNLKGLLNLKGGKLKIGQLEALVESIPISGTAHCAAAPPVMLPPPPVGPQDPGTKVWVFMSFNKTVMINNKAIVANGMVMQGNTAIWPGMMLPSVGNTGPVTINMLPINVVNDQATIFPMGTSAVMSQSGQ